MQVLIGLILIGLLLVSRAVYVSIKIKRDPEITKYGKNPKTAIAVLAIFGSVLLFIGSIGIPIADFFKPEPPDAWKTKDNTTMAYVMMQEFVKEYLKSPGSAKFEWITEPDCEISKDGFEYTIRSWVDSQNDFGSLIRTRFSGVIEQVDADNWRLLTLDFEE
jgi:hypothetical protein